MKKLSTNFGHYLSTAKFFEAKQTSLTHQQQQKTTVNSIVVEDGIFDKEGFNICQIIGNVNKAFILCSFKTNLYLIDQHAASEKSLYVRFLKQKNLLPVAYQGQPFQVQNIYKEVLKEQKNLLKKLGWSFNILEQGSIFLTINLTSVPSIFDRKCRQKQFLEVVEDYYQKSIQELSKSQKESIAIVACHNAYRIGDQLSREDMRKLIDTLYEMPGAYNCPHSRPIIIMIGQAQNFTKQVKGKRKYSLI